MNKNELKGAVESVLFAVGDPITVREMADLLEVVPDTVEEILEELDQDQLDDGRGIYIVRMEDRIQLATKPMYSRYVKKLATVNERQTLGKGALECLAIIAYRQPVTRAEIDEIRGVSSEYVLNKLLERDFIVILGRKDVPGRPRLYGTSDEFLRQFGFADLKAFRDDKAYGSLMDSLSKKDKTVEESDEEAAPDSEMPVDVDA